MKIFGCSETHCWKSHNFAVCCHYEFMVPLLREAFSLLSNLSLLSIQSFSNSPTAFNSIKKIYRNSLKLPSIHETSSSYPVIRYNPETEHCLCCLHTLEWYNKNKHVIDTTIPHINPFGRPPIIYWITSKILTGYSLPPVYLLALLALFLLFSLGLSTMLCLVAQACLPLCDPMDCSPSGSSVHGDSPGKNTGVSCHALFQGIFLIQGSNPSLLHLLHWQVVSLPPASPGKPFSPNMGIQI